MSELNNPFASPLLSRLQTDIATAQAAEGQSCWRDGRLLVVVNAGSELPHCCVKCNAPPLTEVRLKLAWAHPALPYVANWGVTGGDSDFDHAEEGNGPRTTLRSTFRATQTDAINCWRNLVALPDLADWRYCDARSGSRPAIHCGWNCRISEPDLLILGRNHLGGCLANSEPQTN